MNPFKKLFEILNNKDTSDSKHYEDDYTESRITPKSYVPRQIQFYRLRREDDMQIARILTQIEEKVRFDEKEILKKLRELKASVNKNKQLKDALNNSSVDGYEEYSQEKERLEKRKTGLIIEIEKQAQEIALLELKRQNAVADYEKAKEKYLQQIKEKSINDMSQRAIAAYTVLEEQLIRRQSDILQKEFIKSFTAIINKDNFLDGIVIDNNINIIPYKMIDVSFLQIDNYLQANSKTDFLQFFDRKYWKDISDLKIGAVESIRLPSPITAPFSQGERQVYIMSIYLALLKTSRKDVPFFIDTPFARIDSNHRDRIVKNFFKGVKNQLFILSTDEEIVGQYKKLISAEISDQFLLNISDYGQTKIVEDAYFGE
jgi:DNA repair exonuclease SbcCD ATPase subunit